MKTSAVYYLLLIFLMMQSCTTTNISKYYTQHKNVLDSIHLSYKDQYRHKPFSILFTDKSFKHVSLELLTDSIRYIYEFEVSEKRILDTLKKFRMDVNATSSLISAMKNARCTWINTLDYYVDNKKDSMVYMSIKSRSFSIPFNNKKYYILAYFRQPQYYDQEGRLLDNKTRRKIRKINEETFKRVNDKVAYTLSDSFR